MQHIFISIPQIETKLEIIQSNTIITSKNPPNHSAKKGPKPLHLHVVPSAKPLISVNST